MIMVISRHPSDVEEIAKILGFIDLSSFWTSGLDLTRGDFRAWNGRGELTEMKAIHEGL